MSNWYVSREYYPAGMILPNTNVTCYPVLLAQFGFVLVMLPGISHLLEKKLNLCIDFSDHNFYVRYRLRKGYFFCVKLPTFFLFPGCPYSACILLV